jgi:hypothetical protein
MSKRRRGFPSETKLKRGVRAVRGGEKGTHRAARQQRPMPVRLRPALSSVAAGTPAAFDGIGRDYYIRDK